MSKSEGMEHLSSVQNNPWVRKFGQSESSLRHETKKKPNVQSNTENTSELEPEEEYHVNSGFVDKLRSKFAQLENRSQTVTLSRRSASVENLLSVPSSNDYSSNKHNRYGSRQSSTDDTSLSSSSTGKVELRKPGSRTLNRPRSNDIILNRPRSSEIVSKSSDRPPLPKPQKKDFSLPNHVVRNVKPPLPKKSVPDSLVQKRHSSSDITSPRTKTEHHDWTVAPDLESIGRNDLIIIEASAPVLKQKNEQKDRFESSINEDEYRRVKSVRDKDKTGDENELPKPNTVSAFRSLFENAKTTSDVLNVWRQGHSPTRKSSASDTNSPRVTSPVSTPRSPLVRMYDDNVFEISSKNSSDQEVPKCSPRNSVNTDQSSGNSSSEIKPNVDSTPVSIQKSLEMFQNRKASVAADNNFSSPVGSRASSSEPDINPVRSLSPTVQQSLTPMHPISKVFDSKSVKVDKPKHSKPVLVKRKTSIPKDTLELKHEADKANSVTPTCTEESKSVVKNSVANANENMTIINISDESRTSPEDTVSGEANVKPSARKSGKTSPRKTKVFDSSNIVKRKGDPPKVPLSPAENQEVKLPLNNMPKQVSIEIKDKDKVTDMEISPVKPARRSAPEPSTNGITAVKTNIVVNNEMKPPNVKDSDFPIPLDTRNNRVRPSPKTIDNDEKLVSGRSSFLTNRLKNAQGEQDTQLLKTTSVHLANGSSPSPVPRKRQAPERPLVNGIDDVEMQVEEKVQQTPPPLPSTKEPTLPSTNIDDIINRQKKKTAHSSTKLVFDSSKIVTKRKEPPKRKPPRKTVDQLNDHITFDVSVPKLDLTSITDDKQESTEYQEGYIPTVIKPCPFKFLGAEIVFEKSPFKRVKKRKANVKIAFDDHATTTFEYVAEDTALESYLEEHPDERDEVMKLESQEHEYIHGMTETQDDLVHDPPHPPEHDTQIKPNTVIGISAGALTNYKSKMQMQDFQFGSTPEPDDDYDYQEPEPDSENPDSMNLLPADESELDAFSAETGKADMLF